MAKKEDKKKIKQKHKQKQKQTQNVIVNINKSSRVSSTKKPASKSGNIISVQPVINIPRYAQEYPNAYVPARAPEPVASRVTVAEPVAARVQATEPVAPRVPVAEPVAARVQAAEPVAARVQAAEPVAVAVSSGVAAAVEAIKREEEQRKAKRVKAKYETVVENLKLPERPFAVDTQRRNTTYLKVPEAKQSKFTYPSPFAKSDEQKITKFFNQTEQSNKAFKKPEEAESFGISPFEEARTATFESPLNSEKEFYTQFQHPTSRFSESERDIGITPQKLTESQKLDIRYEKAFGKPYQGANIKQKDYKAIIQEQERQNRQEKQRQAEQKRFEKQQKKN